MAKKKSTRPMGTPPKYTDWLTEKKLAKIKAWVGSGMYMKDVAANMGIHYATLCDWRNTFSEIDDAIKEGRKDAIALVEDALYKKAYEGYELSEKKYVAVELDKKQYELKVQEEMAKFDKEFPNATEQERYRFEVFIPRTEMVLVEDKIKKTAPDTAAQVFYLKNMNESQWRDRRYYEGTENVTVNNPVEHLSVEELKALALKQIEKGD